VPFRLESVLTYLEFILENKGHAVICVAEGAAEGLRGQEEYHRPRGNSTDGDDDPSNEALDVGAWLKSKIKEHLADVDVKYIDPSYLIRSIASTSTDRIYCRMLANGAVHGAFSGYTGITVGLVNTHFVYLPIDAVRGGDRRKNDADDCMVLLFLCTG
jgi:6-phosphofructokinase 1